MNEATARGWRPEDDVAYGQRLALHLLWKYRYLLLAMLVLGGLIGTVIALLLPPVYTASASILVEKAGGTGLSLPDLPYVSGSTAPLDTEVQVLTSRRLAQQVVDELALHIEVIDKQVPDAASSRISNWLGLADASPHSRREQYTRLGFKDIEIDPDLLNPVKLLMRVDEAGNWRIRDLRGSAGDPVEFSWVKFTPVFGKAHDAAASYRLIVKPNYRALWDFQRSLSVRPAQDRANVVTIIYRDRNPVLCQLVIETLLRRYFAHYQGAQLADYDVILEYIAAETEEAEESLTTVLAELESFREERQYYEPTAQSASAVEAIAVLSRQRSSQDIQITHINNLLARMESQPPEEIYQALEAPVTQLELEQNLVQRLADLINSRERELMVKTPAHPDVQELEASIGVALSQIEDSLRSQLDKLRVANQRLASDIQQERSFLATLPAAEAKVVMLEGDLKAQQGILSMLKQREAETRLMRAGIETEVRLLDAPELPVLRTSPRTTKNAGLGAVLGLLLAVLVGLFWESTRRQFTTLREIRLGTGLPVLAAIPNHLQLHAWHPGEEHADLYRKLAEFLPCRGRVLGIVHPASEGDYRLAWGLAGAVGREEHRALIVDLDRSAGNLTGRLQDSVRPGFGELAKGQCALADAIRPIGKSRILLASGESSTTVEEALQLLAMLREQYSAVVVCLPHPQLWSGAGVPWTGIDEVVISVPQVGYGRAELQGALATMNAQGVRPRGVVVTGFVRRNDVLGKAELQHIAVPLPG